MKTPPQTRDEGHRPLPVTIAVVGVVLEPGRYLVAAWLSAATSAGARRTRGLADVWVGSPRDGLARAAAEGLRLLKRPSEVVIVMRAPNRSEPPPTAETAAYLTEAAAQHQVRYERIPKGEPNPELEAAEVFAKARAAGHVGGPRAPEADAPARPTDLPARPGKRLF